MAGSLGRSDRPMTVGGPVTHMRVTGLSKSFGGTHALRDFRFDLRVGEVHALVGGNGSGKSTFIKILAGVHQADGGRLHIGDVEWDLTRHTPAEASAAGLRFVHQDLGIFPQLSIADNLSISHGFVTGRGRRIKWRATRDAARRTLRRFHVDADPRAQATVLSTPQRAMLAIARALQDFDGTERGVLVLDEPTASLPPEEAELLLESIRRRADEGHAVLLVTHRLDEVRKVADRVTALRDGSYAGTVGGENLGEAGLSELILGRRLVHAPAVAPLQKDVEPVLEVSGLRGTPIRDVSFDVRAGEIVGIAGLLGSGRTELLEYIFGAREADGGEVAVAGRRAEKLTPQRMSELGVAYVPEDRQNSALFPEHTVAENMTSGYLAPFFNGVKIRDRDMARSVRDDLARFQVKASGPAALIETLSGGNQQKVVLARWLRRDPKVLLLDEPDQGIDVGAREEIFGLLKQATAGGAGVVLVSSEFQALARLCHRVLILAGGRIVDEKPHGTSGHELLEAVLTYVR